MRCDLAVTRAMGTWGSLKIAGVQCDLLGCRLGRQRQAMLSPAEKLDIAFRQKLRVQ